MPLTWIFHLENSTYGESKSIRGNGNKNVPEKKFHLHGFHLREADCTFNLYFIVSGTVSSFQTVSSSICIDIFHSLGKKMKICIFENTVWYGRFHFCLPPWGGGRVVHTKWESEIGVHTRFAIFYVGLCVDTIWYFEQWGGGQTIVE